MRMLAGFEQPTEGRILLQGKDLSGTPPYRRPTNMMFQSYALFPAYERGKEHRLRSGAGCLPKADIAARVEEMLKLVKLEAFASASLPSFPVASGSVWRSPALSPNGPRCSCWMSRSARWIATARRNPVRTDGYPAYARADLPHRKPMIMKRQ